MDAVYYEDKKFADLDLAGAGLADREYIACEFSGCDLSKADLTGTIFSDCIFYGCNLSLAKTANTGLKTVQFTESKLVGIDFSQCGEFLFDAVFNDCNLDYSSFFKRKLKNTVFTGCSLKEVDFTAADLTGAKLDDCDLMGTVFVQTNLEKADLRTARNYSFDPELNRMRGARLSSLGLAGLLGKYEIRID